MRMDNISIRKANINDVDSIVSIHKQAFNNFFLTSLGDRFLRLYYTSFISSRDGVVYCAVKDANLVGYSACCYVSKGFNLSLIRKNLLKYGAEFLRLLYRNPKAILRLTKNLRKESNDLTIEDNGLYAELFSIAVDPGFQGGGVGKLLLTVTEGDVKNHNSFVSLTTDYYNNDKPLAFYRSLGYKEYYDFIAYPDRRMLRLIKQID